MGHREINLFSLFKKKVNPWHFLFRWNVPMLWQTWHFSPTVCHPSLLLCLVKEMYSHKSSKENPGYALLWFKSINELFSPEFFLILIKWKFGLKTGSWTRLFFIFLLFSLSIIYFYFEALPLPNPEFGKLSPSLIKNKLKQKPT